MTDAGSIRIRPNGPYAVSGDVPLVWATPVADADGDRVGWSWGPPIETDAAGYRLCRCGQSANKPFCDGSHERLGFDGTLTADPAPRATRVRTYQGDDLVVRDDRSICEHASFCTNRVSNVWKMVRHTDDPQVREQVRTMVEACPSGALSYAVEPDGPDVEPELPRQVNVVPDGPLWVTGGIPIETDEGATLDPRNRVTLCRCGGSATKPLCDGSHRGNGFGHRP